jgi:signal peptidase II
MRKLHIFIAALVLLVDRTAKWTIEQTITLNDSVGVFPGFRLTHVQNRGAAFGLFAESSSEWKLALLVLSSLIAMTVVTYLLWKYTHTLNSTSIGLALILGGAFGNLWDRVTAGHVVDFMDFYFGTFHWPAFNIADSAIIVGALMLVAEIIAAKPPSEEVEQV